ncbi:MAG: hypothetical protein AAGB29_03100 [Planctomycetota bacterium]
MVVMGGPMLVEANDKATGKYETKVKLKTKLAGSGTQKSKFTEDFKVSSKKITGKAEETSGSVTRSAQFKLKLDEKAETGGKIKADGKFIDKGSDSGSGDKFKNTLDVTKATFSFKGNRNKGLTMKGKAKAKGTSDIGAGPQNTTVTATFRGKE